MSYVYRRPYDYSIRTAIRGRSVSVPRTALLIGPACVTAINLAVPSVSAVYMAVPAVTAINLAVPSVSAIHLEACE